MMDLGEVKFTSVFDFISESELSRKPFSIRVLIENVSRNLKEEGMEERFLEVLVNWGRNCGEAEIGFKPCRVLMQDFTGVPIIVDLAAMRDKVRELGRDPRLINPKVPVHLVIDHSLQVDYFGEREALRKNLELEFRRNLERYELLKWAQRNFSNLKVVPPGNGIIHQINLEYIAGVVLVDGGVAKYDTLIGTDSHTTMVNGLGVLGWGVGGIEAEAVILGQPYFMKLPEVVGVHVKGKTRDNVNATDVVLFVTSLLRSVGVVDKFVEFFGEGVRGMDVETRATIANMAPEYGATMGFFAVDEKTLDYLYRTGRSRKHIELVEKYTKLQGLWCLEDSYEKVEFSQVVELRLDEVEPAIAGPGRPQDRVTLSLASENFRRYLFHYKSFSSLGRRLRDGDVVIASITSCTNTSNPYVLIEAGLLAKKAVERGLSTKPHVKTSFAPGSRVVCKYLEDLGLQKYLDELGFSIVGYGCATCIGNSGPLPEWVEEEIRSNDILAVSVISGNRNFEGRIHPLVKANYLASPALVVAYAIAGNITVNLEKEPIGYDSSGSPVYLRDIFPSSQETKSYFSKVNFRKYFENSYEGLFEGTDEWKKIDVREGDVFEWKESSYIRKPPYFDTYDPGKNYLTDIIGARVLLLLGDSITTDHISPAGEIDENSPAGQYLLEKGVRKEEFNSYGARRGNYEVMVRGTFANPRIRNLMLKGKEGGYTLVCKGDNWLEATVFEAGMFYKSLNIPTIVIGGKEYGTGSSRDWAAKGPYLLGVRAVIAESFERIHRSNLIGMGIVPLEFINSNRETLRITGKEIFNITGIGRVKPGGQVEVEMIREDGSREVFSVKCRIDTENELNIVRSGGIMQKVLSEILTKSPLKTSL